MKSLKIIMALMATLTVTACGSKEPVKPIEETKELSDIEKQVKNDTDLSQDGIELSDIKISEYGASNLVTGKVQNTTSNERNIRLSLMMYNTETNRMLGAVEIEVKNFQPNETRTFELKIMGDYTTVDRYSIKVTEL